MRTWALAFAFAAVMAPGFAGTATAVSSFDFVYVDTLEVRGPLGGFDLRLVSPDFALLVNTGDAPITNDELLTAHFAAASTFGCWIHCFLDSVGIDPQPQLGTIAPHEAFGCVLPGYNDMLLAALAPGEVLHNTAPRQMWGLELYVAHPSGLAACPETLSLGDRRVTFTIVMDMTVSPSISLVPRSVARASSAKTVPVIATTWGRVKALYR